MEGLTWEPVRMPADCDTWATPYGFMLDHVWREPELNVARRQAWPAEMYVVVQPCSDLELSGELNEGVTHWIFFDSGLEYAAPPEDLKATDWWIGRLGGAAQCAAELLKDY